MIRWWRYRLALYRRDERLLQRYGVVAMRGINRAMEARRCGEVERASRLLYMLARHERRCGYPLDAVNLEHMARLVEIEALERSWQAEPRRA